ncbi:MAG: peptidase, partial [Beijerinckiaceae bacterium]
MTYCAGVLVREGLVVVADTRTNAGLDNISTFRKLNVLDQYPDRVLILASAGNLSITQSVVGYLSEGIENPDTGEIETLGNVPTVFRAAQLIGHAVRKVRSIEREALEAADINF